MTMTTPSSAAGVLNPLRQTKRRLGESLIKGILVLAAAVSLFTTFGIVISVLIPSLEFFAEIPLTEFLFTTTWTPLFANPQYGVLPLVMGTLVITIIAVAVAIPLGLGSAIYLSEYASPRARKVLKPTLEVLAGIPTVVFG
ncbi:MAG: PstC family ABC transporter permease, partial [Actinomycetota bacterium]